MAFNVGTIEGRVKLTYDSKGLQSLDKDMRKAESSMGKLDKRSSKLGGALKSGLKVGAAAAGTAIVGGLAVGLKTAISEAREAEKVMRLTNNAIKASGGVANVTAKEIENLSTKLSNKTAIDDETIQSSANLLLTFRNIRNEAGKNNDIFDQATSTALDMAEAYGVDLPSATKMLGKALQDPANAASALKRTGAIDQAGVEQIQKMAENGASNLQMQKKLLNEINKAGVKGAAEAAADPLQRVNVIIKNLLEDIGGKLLPHINKAADALSKFAMQFMNNKGAGGEFRKVLLDIYEVFKGLWPTLKTIGSAVASVMKGFAGLSGPMKMVTASFVAFLAIGLKLAAFFRVAPLMMGPVGLAIGVIGMGAVMLIKHWDEVKKFLGKVWNWIKKAFADVSETVVRLAKKGFLGPIPFIIANWNRIKDFFGALPGRIASGLRTLGGIILAPFKWAYDRIRSVLDRIISVFRGAVDKVKGVVSAVGGAVGAVGNALGFAKGGQVRQGTLFVAGEKGPEWVINTRDKSVRQDNVGYLMQAASEMGIPMFAKGGRTKPGRLNKKIEAMRTNMDLKRREFELSGGVITTGEYNRLIDMNKKIEGALLELVKVSKGQAKREARFALRAAQLDRRQLVSERNGAGVDAAGSTPNLDFAIADLQTQLELAQAGYGGDAESIRSELKSKLEKKLKILRDRLSKTNNKEQIALLQDAISSTLGQLSSIGSGSGGPSIVEQVATASRLRFDALSQFGSNAMQSQLGFGGQTLARQGGTTVVLNGEFKLDSNDPHQSVRQLGHQIAQNLT